MSKKRGKYYNAPKGGELFVCFVATALFLAFMYVLTMHHSPLDMVRKVINCQDGTQRELFVDDATPADCVQVDGEGNLIKYDVNTGNVIYVDPATGKIVEGQD